MRSTSKVAVGLAAAGLMAVAGSAMATENLVGLNFSTAGAAKPDPQNWTRISSADGSQGNLMDDTGASTDVGVSWGPVTGGGFVYLGTDNVAADAVPQHDYDLGGMSGYGFRSDGNFFVEFSGLKPNEDYFYWFVGYRSVSAIDNVVNVSDGDTPNATQFRQSISSTDNDGRFLVNDVNANDSMQWSDLSFVTESSSQGTLRFEWEGDTQTTVVGAVAVQLVPAPGSMALLGLAGLAACRRRRR